jgi:hypothetical protein
MLPPVSSRYRNLGHYKLTREIAVVNTLIQHYAHKVGTLGRRKELEEEATDDVLFDE